MRKPAKVLVVKMEKVMKKKSKEDIEDELKSIGRKRNELILQLNDIQEKIASLTEQYYEMDPSMVKVVCINCQGTGYIKEGEKKQICKLCNGKHYNWFLKFKEQKKEED